MSYQSSGILSCNWTSFWINNPFWDFLSSLALFASMIFLFDSYPFLLLWGSPSLPLAMGFSVWDVLPVSSCLDIGNLTTWNFSSAFRGKKKSSSLLWKQIFIIRMLSFFLVFSKTSLLLRFKKCMCGIHLKNICFLISLKGNSEHYQ